VPLKLNIKVHVYNRSYSKKKEFGVEVLHCNFDPIYIFFNYHTRFTVTFGYCQSTATATWAGTTSKNVI
jgi:hypothetical protein